MAQAWCYSRMLILAKHIPLPHLEALATQTHQVLVVNNTSTKLFPVPPFPVVTEQKKCETSEKYRKDHGYLKEMTRGDRCLIPKR